MFEILIKIVIDDNHSGAAEKDAAQDKNTTADTKDPLLEDAARYVVMTGNASTLALQRKYEIGYNRAGRIIDRIEAYGIIGPHKAGLQREVLVDPESLESILSSIQDD